MDKAKAAVSEFMAKAGHHDTTVHEKVAPAVTHETINRHRHEEVQTAIDKEIHQDHYHTSVQPVFDREVLPEQHQHQLAGVEHRHFEHGNAQEVAARLEREAAQFVDKRIEGQTTETRSTAPVIAGEHIHHHVHETIQPVVQKEVIAPTVIHTTVPIHEVHHNAPQHHTTSALPAVSMADFKKQGGVLTGREERYDGFEGEPRSVGGALTGGALSGGAATGTGLTGTGTTGHHTGAGVGAAGVGAAGLAGAGAAGSGLTGRRQRSGSSSSSSSDEGKRTGTRTGTTGTTGTTGKSSGGLLAKLDPRVDSNNDGKAGFMK